METWRFNFTQRLPAVCICGRAIEIFYLHPDHDPPQPGCIDFNPDQNPDLGGLAGNLFPCIPVGGEPLEIEVARSGDTISASFEFTHGYTGDLITADLSGSIVDDQVSFMITYHLPNDLQHYSMPLSVYDIGLEMEGPVNYTLPAELTGFYQGTLQDRRIDGTFNATILDEFAVWHLHMNTYMVKIDPFTGAQTREYLILNATVEWAFSNLTIGGYFIAHTRVPVILVHGWHGSPETWDTLRSRLDSEGIEYYIFDYSPATGNPQVYAEALSQWISKLRVDRGYSGRFDIVCHSMGALVSRWYMEELDGANNVRQWIGICPVNHGAALADMTDWWYLSWLKIFFPLLNEVAVDQMKTTSPTVVELEAHGKAPDVVYRVIVGVNTDPSNRFQTLLGGKTLAKCDCSIPNPYYKTFLGDGVVAARQSVLAGAGVDCFQGLTHNMALHDPDVIDQVTEYLKDPTKPSANNLPPEDPSAHDHFVIGTGNRGYLNKGEYKTVTFPIDSTVKEATILTAWSGSQLNVTLTSPIGETIEPFIYPAIDYWNISIGVGYVIDLPEPGIWKADIYAVDVSESGEPYIFLCIYNSSLTAKLTTSEATCYYNLEDCATILVSLTNGASIITGALAEAVITQPDGTVDRLTLYDDGSHSDILANDGNYTNIYLLSLAGCYDVTAYINVTGDQALERMAFQTLWVATIIPEFPPLIIIPFFMTATLIAIMHTRKRKNEPVSRSL